MRYLLAFLLPLTTLAQQPAGNEWIDYGQPYYKIPLAKVGLYRVTQSQLQRAGVPAGQIDPRTIQLFHRGTEQAITVAGEADGRFDAGDYLEFYGRGNDGLADSALYRGNGPDGSPAQPHVYFSLFSDTTAYFLTWRTGGQPGRRMATYTDTAMTGLKPEPYHWADDVRLFTSTYPGYAAGSAPKIEYSHYEPGEGHTGPVQQAGIPYTNPFTLYNAYRNDATPKLDILVVGRDFTRHRVIGSAGPKTSQLRQLGQVNFSEYSHAHLRDSLSWSDVGLDGQLLVSTVSQTDSLGPDRYSVSLIHLRYPQAITADGQPLRTFRLMANPINRSVLSVGSALPNTRFFDISDPATPVQIGASQTGTTAQLVVRNTQTERTILGVGPPDSVGLIQRITFRDFRNRRPGYVIISHDLLMQPTPGSPNAVRQYATYRASAAGGNFDTLTVTMQQLIDQFSYGERHPLSIRRFLSQLFRQSQTGPQPQYLLLLGRGRSAAGIRQNPAQTTLDLVMTMGFPSSDAAFSAGLAGFPADVPALPTGRVNAGTPAEVLAYLEKVTEYEQTPPDAPWRKNVLHLSGGQSGGEVKLFRSIVDTYRTLAEGASLGASVTTISKQTDAPTEAFDVKTPVNEGVGLMTFFGHAGLDVTDLDIGFVSSDALGYRNGGRYPVLLINGCAIGNFFFGRPTLSADWVLTPRRGAIASLAQSHLGYVNTLDQYSRTFYQLLADKTWLSRSIGQLQQETVRRVLAQSPAGHALANAEQMVLQGDPAIQLFPFTTPDFILTANTIRVTDTSNQPVVSSSDSVVIRAVVRNAGQVRMGPLPVQLRRFVNGQAWSVSNLRWPRTVANRDTIRLTLPNAGEVGGLNRFELTLNPIDRRDALPEINHTNNDGFVEAILPTNVPPALPPRANMTLPEGQISLPDPLPTDVRQGDIVPVRIAFTNLSSVPFADSLLVRQTLYAASLDQPQQAIFRVKAPAPGDTLRFPVSIETTALSGLNQLILTVNPGLQPEHSLLNNTISVVLPVQPDRLAPVLDVAIDGIRINDNAVVSARPRIDVLVADDNRSLLRQDTTGLTLALQRPGQSTFEPLSWRNATLQPAQADNIFRVQYRSEVLAAGTYRLQATARDAVGNVAPPYQTRFRVVNEQSLTDLTVYPNPFREQTLFRFVLTGGQPPNYATLTITDLADRPVRHLSASQSGLPVRIGLNEWAWDGRSDAGALLPAGIYLYTLTLDSTWSISESARTGGRVLLMR